MNNKLASKNTLSIKDFQNLSIELAELAAACMESCGEYVDSSHSGQECQLDVNTTIAITVTGSYARIQIRNEQSGRQIYDATANPPILRIDTYDHFRCERAKQTMESFLASYAHQPLNFSTELHSKIREIEINL